MAREVIESVKVVVKTEDGNRIALESKGSAPRGMLTAFTVLPIKRREWLLKHMQAEHTKMLARDADRAVPADTQPPVTCAAGHDGDCTHAACPQLKDGEPKATGRHCPLDTGSGHE